MAKSRNVWEYNFAKNEAIVDAVRKTIIPKLKSSRDGRSELESIWMRDYNIWNVVHDDAHLYSGRAKLYIPEVRKNIEAQARQLTDMAFPSDQYLECMPGTGGTRKGAALHKAIRQWQVEQAQLPIKFHVHNRQKCLYGTSVAYVAWSKRVEHVFKNARNPKTGKIQASRQLMELFNGPDFIVRDLFRWYTLNIKKADLGDEGCAEIQVLNRFDLVQKDRAGLLVGLDEILKGNSDAYSKEELYRDVERAENLGLHINPTQGYAGVAALSGREDPDNPTINNYMCTTVYAKIECPDACLEEEDPSLGIPMKIEIYDNEHVGFVGRNPFFHQRPPYVVGKYILPGPDEFYGQGIPQATRYMQYELNSKAEQNMDSVTYALNPIAFIDPAMTAQNANFEMEPGAKWFVNPAGVKFGAMPDVSATGLTAIGSLRSQIQDFSDRQPSLPSQLAGKARTATQAQIVNDVISLDTKAFQRQQELMELEPLMQMFESLTEQNAEDDQMVLLLGKNSTNWQKLIAPRNLLLGNYTYFWRVSTSQQNKQLQARQMIDMLKVYGALPPEIQAKTPLDLPETFRTIFRELLDIPNADKIMPSPDEQISQDPATILKMLTLGMEVEVLPGDDNASIIRFLADAFRQEKDKVLQKQIAEQMLKQKQALEAKMQQAQAQHAQQLAMMHMQMQAQAQGGQKGGGARGGNRTQLSPNASTGDMASGLRA
jgi:hypothetical protein